MGAKIVKKSMVHSPWSIDFCALAAYHTKVAADLPSREYVY